MGQIIKSLLSFCLSFCKHSYGRNFDSILMKFCTVNRGLKSKIEFVWDKKSDYSFNYFISIFNPRNAFPMEMFLYHSRKSCGLSGV